MAKLQTGFAITIKAFAETNNDIQLMNEITTAYLYGNQTGDYSNLLKMVTVEEATAVPMRRRVVSEDVAMEVDEGEQVDEPVSDLDKALELARSVSVDD